VGSLSYGQSTIAITEFMSNPLDSESTDEYIELYNYGTTAVDIQNWHIGDEDVDDDVITTAPFSIQPGGLCVIAKNKSVLEAIWFNGIAHPNILEVPGLTMANSLDELILTDATANVVWSLAYQNDETAGIATHYTELTDFTNTVWGSKTVPGIDRSGNDPATGSLGYQDNNITADPEAFTSSTGDIGSPLNINLPPPTSCATVSTYRISSGWDNGSPDVNTQAIIAEDYTTTTANLMACDLVVSAGATLTINGGEWASVANHITVQGRLIIAHEGSIVQVDALGTVTKGGVGTIEVHKTTPTLAPLDFMFLSSPMTGETRDGVYASSFRIIEVISSNFTVDPALETTDPMDPYFGAELFLGADNSFLGNYVGSELLTPGDGLVVYPQAAVTDGGSTYNLTYQKGVLNNGDISYAIQYNGLKKNNFNLLGNPYASAIDIDLLIDNNDMISEIYFWEHLTAPSNTIPGYLTNNYSMNDISIYNKSGSVGSGTPAANGGIAPGRYMASGQGFAIKADQGGAASALFTNTMRVVDNNDQYRTNETKDRLWINVRNEDYQIQSTALIAFLEEASPRMELGYDSRRIAAPISLFSKSAEGDVLSIQGTSTFDTAMKVNLGFASVIEESLHFTISIDQVEGTHLSDQPIYLIDTETQIATLLNTSDYRFTATRGMQANRFILVFEAPENLGVDALDIANNIRLFPNPTNGQLTIMYSGTEALTTMTIMTTEGQIVKQISLANFDQEHTLDLRNLARGMYLIEINSTKGRIIKKLILH
jgi:hypothetical protein